MPKAATYQCPNCGGAMVFDPKLGKLVCEYCESVFDEGEVEGQIPSGDGEVERREVRHATSIEDFLERAPWEVGEDGAVNAVVYTCPACAAQVAADQSTVSMTCPYCGNNMLVQGLATSDNVPEWVLPFSVTREEAEQRLRDHFQHKWYLSRAFDARLKHMQGMYIPYHLYDLHVEGRADYVGYETHTWTDKDGDTHEEHFYYAIKRAGHASFERVPIDGSSKMPDGHMDAIAPFFFDKMKEFSPSYVSGYLMEVADEDRNTCLPKARERVRTSFVEGLKSDACAELKIDGIEETVSAEEDITLTGAADAVLPVWMMHCTWDDHVMLFAVNGDTGKCVGDLPVEGKRRVATISAIAGTLSVISIILFVALLSGDGDMEDVVKFIGGALTVIVFVTFFADAHFMGQMHTAVEATNANMSYDSEGLVVTERWMGGRHHSRGRARSDL